MNDGILVSAPLDTSLLTSWEDHIQAFIELQQERESLQWSQADVILSVYQKFGGDVSVAKFANQLRVPRSTVEHYIRTAIAFPPPKRLPEVNFTVHTEASYVDTFHGKEHAFEGEKRFTLLEEAADDRITVAEMKKKVKREKAVDSSDQVKIACYLCGGSEGEVREYLVLSKSENESRRTADNFDMHESCWSISKQKIDDEREKRQL